MESGRIPHQPESVSVQSLIILPSGTYLMKPHLNSLDLGFYTIRTKKEILWNWLVMVTVSGLSDTDGYNHTLRLLEMSYRCVCAALFAMCALMLSSTMFLPSTQTVRPAAVHGTCHCLCSRHSESAVHMHPRYCQRLNEFCGKRRKIPGSAHLLGFLTNRISFHQVLC